MKTCYGKISSIGAPSRRAVGRAPLRSLREFAGDVDVPFTKIVSLVAKSKCRPPTPVFSHHGPAQANSYYNLAELQAWWERETA